MPVDILDKARDEVVYKPSLSIALSSVSYIFKNVYKFLAIVVLLVLLSILYKMIEEILYPLAPIF